jgi:hypothetical protein
MSTDHISYIDEGITAHEQGQRQAENPYIKGSNAWLWWNDGWEFANQRHEQLELVSA